MTDKERQELGIIIANTGVYYSRQLQPAVVSMMLDDLIDLPFDEVRDAYTKYRRDSKNRTFPLPAQIREMVSPTIDNDSMAREIASRISGAIVRYGWCNPEDAAGFIGPIGWSIIQRQGGWRHLCENHGRSIDPTTFQAQVRELAKSALTHSPEEIERTLKLGPAKRSSGLVRIGDIE